MQEGEKLELLLTHEKFKMIFTGPEALNGPWLIGATVVEMRIVSILSLSIRKIHYFKMYLDYI